MAADSAATEPFFCGAGILLTGTFLMALENGLFCGSHIKHNLVMLWSHMIYPFQDTTLLGLPIPSSTVSLGNLSISTWLSIGHSPPLRPIRVTMVISNRSHSLGSLPGR